MSRSTPIAPITFPSASRSAEAFSVVGITSPEALRGLRTAFRVTPRSTTSRKAAVNSRVSSALMKRESDCSTTSSWRKPSSCETASFAWRILPSRSETNTGSGAFLMMMSATRTSPAGARFALAGAPFRSTVVDADLTGVFFATGRTLPRVEIRFESRGCVFIVRPVFQPRNRGFSAASVHFYCYLAEPPEIRCLGCAKSLVRRVRAEYERPAERSLCCEGGDLLDP